jgi:hypothetical protein
VNFTVRLLAVDVVFFDFSETVSEARNDNNAARLGFLATKGKKRFSYLILFTAMIPRREITCQLTRKLIP